MIPSVHLCFPQVDTIAFAGHDTTAASIFYTLYMLAINPDIVKKVEEELDGIFHNTDRTATMEDLTNMKYLECCIKETLRLFPSVPYITREHAEDIVVRGHVIPANTEILLFIYGQHRNPDDFPEPYRFDPDRWTDSNSFKRHPYAYVPFSAGSRNCLGQKFAGMEQKVVVSTILRSFSIRTDLKREVMEKSLVPEIILRPSEGIPLYLEKKNI
jgi:cytochrome P450